MPDNGKITALYCRVASADSLAIEMQKQNLLAYAERHGFGSIEVYADNGYSGLNTDRPEFRRLENDMWDGRVCRLIVKDISRISRNYLSLGEWLDRVKAAGITFISVSDGFMSKPEAVTGISG